jgi:hypothetical protein
MLSPISKRKAKKKICPLMSIAKGSFYSCGRETCMFWSDSADKRYGCCEIKEALISLAYLHKVIEDVKSTK